MKQQADFALETPAAIPPSQPADLVLERSDHFILPSADAGKRYYRLGGVPPALPFAPDLRRFNQCDQLAADRRQNVAAEPIQFIAQRP